MKKSKLNICLALLLVGILFCQSSALAVTAMTANGDTTDKADTGRVYSHLNANSNYTTIRRAGYQSATADVSDFRTADDYTVLYWSSHGGDNGTHASLNVINGPEFNATSNAASYWTNSALKVAIFSSCYTLNAGPRKKWVGIMRNSDVRVIAGYHEKSAGSPADVSIADAFFKRIKEGKSVRMAWQGAHTNARGIWVLLSYVGSGREDYKMPGFQSNSSPAPTSSTSIYRFSNAYLDGTAQPKSGGNPNVSELPYAIEVSRSVIPVNLAVFGGGKQYSAADEITKEIRDSVIEPINPYEVTAKAKKALSQLGSIDKLLSTAHIKEQRLLMAEVTEEGEGPESTIGGFVEFQQTINGIPIHSNSFTIGVDANGVFEVRNSLKIVNDSSEAKGKSANSYISMSKATAIAVSAAGNNKRAMKTSYAYADNGTGNYVLNYLVNFDDGREYLVDCVSGAVREG